MDGATWKEKYVDSEHSEGSSGTPPDRKRKHKDKKRKKDKKHKHHHHEKTAEDKDEAPSRNPTATSATQFDSSTEPVAGQPEIEAADNRPKREEWMGDSESSFLFPSVLQQDLRRTKVNAKTAAREAQQRETERLYKARELNPFIHKTDAETKKEEPNVPVPAVGDGGASWLKRAFRRLEEQAEDKGCSVEEAAAERFGSLDQLKKMIAAAEIREGIPDSSTSGSSRTETGDRRRVHEDDRRSGRDRNGYSREGRKRDDSSLLPSSSRNITSQRDSNREKSPENTRSGRERDQDRREADWQFRRNDNQQSRDRPRDNRDRASREKPLTSKVQPTFVKPGDDLPSSWKAKDRVQYVPKSNYTPAEKKARLEAAEEREEIPDGLESKKIANEADSPGLSDAELNQLNAGILRAELMGDSDTVSKLKARIASAGQATPNLPGPSKRVTESVVLSLAHSKGFSYPVKTAANAPSTGKQPKTATHNASGEREKYFADDDKYSLSQLVSMEKMQSAEDQNAMFARLAGKVTEKTDDEYGMDDAFIKKALNKESLDQMSTRDRDKAIMEHRQMGVALGSCLYCHEGPKFLKHLVVAVGRKVLLMLPPGAPLTEGHCLICPIQHVTAGTSLDEEVWEEMQAFRRALVKMFEKNEEDCVFMETVMNLKGHPHMRWECIPLDLETGSTAPMYFKKAILEAEGEWTQNVKLVDLSKKDIRHAIPKNFPYFSVDFGMQGGYAHVIEDERKFPAYFGREIVGGMIDAEPRLWLKTVPLNFNEQMKNVNNFNKLWQEFDFTQEG